MDHIHENRFVIFLISIALLLFGELFISSKYQSEVDLTLLLQNFLCSSVLFIRRPKIEIILVVLVIIGAVVTEIYQFVFVPIFPAITSIIFFAYFGLVGHRIFSDILLQNKVNIQTVAAVFCGYMLIGLIAAMTFITLNSATASFEGGDISSFSSFFYFSFITLLTIGYGDITPITEVSQKLVILFGLIGHFYSVFVIAIIVGKLLKSQE